MKTSRKAIVALLIFSFIGQLHQLNNSLIAYIGLSYPEISQTTTTLILTLPNLVGLVVSFTIGPLALNVNKKTLLTICGFTHFIYFAIFALTGGSGSFILLLVGAGFAGVAQGAATNLISSSISEFAGAKKSAPYLAISNALMSLGSVIINLFGGYIASGNNGASWHYSYYLGFITLPIVVIFACLMPAHPEHADSISDGEPVPASDEGPDKIQKTVFALMCVSVLSGLCIAVFAYNISNYIILEYELGSSVQAGLATSIFTFSSVVFSFTYSIWEKLFKKWTVSIAYIAVAIGCLIISVFHTTIYGAYIGAVLIGAGFALFNPGTVSKLMQNTPSRLIPVIMSINLGIVNVASFFSPYILNFLSNLLGGVEAEIHS